MSWFDEKRKKTWLGRIRDKSQEQIIFRRAGIDGVGISFGFGFRWTGFKNRGARIKVIDYKAYWPKMEKDLRSLLGIPYRLGAEYDPRSEWPPKELDCSELVEIIHKRHGIKCSDGSWVIRAECVCPVSPRPGDLGFFAKESKRTPHNPLGIYHVGMLLDEDTVIEARAKDAKGRYGEVILRPRANWEAYAPFVAGGGWLRLAVLA